jgi:anti-sigma B factor antagonist
MQDPDSGQLLRIDVEEQEDLVVVGVAGEIDHLTEVQLRGAVDHVLGQLRGRVLVLNLAGVVFLGSPGLSILVGAARKATAAGGALRVAAGGRRVRRPVEIAGLDGVLSLYDSLEEALAG